MNLINQCLVGSDVKKWPLPCSRQSIKNCVADGGLAATGWQLQGHGATNTTDCFQGILLVWQDARVLPPRKGGKQVILGDNPPEMLPTLHLSSSFLSFGVLLFIQNWQKLMGTYENGRVRNLLERRGPALR
jgi:hypothetical protein